MNAAVMFVGSRSMAGAGPRSMTGAGDCWAGSWSGSMAWSMSMAWAWDCWSRSRSMAGDECFYYSQVEL